MKILRRGVSEMKVCVIGGGASGMVAAITAARAGAQVTILEKNDRLGKKILVTGNGRCNLGNRNLSKEQYYSEDLAFVDRVLDRFGTEETISFFRSIGLLVREKNGYLYPYSEQASSVLDVLRYELEQLGVILRTGCPVRGLDRSGSGTFRVMLQDEQLFFDRVILACGSQAAPKTGSSGDGYLFARQLGLTLLPVVPALVQLRCRGSFWKAVAGVRSEGRLCVMEKGRLIASERGELQLTEYGVSGIPTFQLSRIVNRLLANSPEVELFIDFMPDQPDEFFSDFTRNMKKRTRTVEEYFAGLWNKKLLQVFLKEAGLRPSDSVRNIPRQTLERVYAISRHFSVVCTGSNSFDQAQVCAGGVSLDELTDELEAKKVPGLYLIGELLDVDGKCGGYNLHWAWSTGYIAGSAAAEET